MKKGFDAGTNLTTFAAPLATAGYSFVCRYYNVNNPAKNLTLSEARTLSAAGLTIVSVWENGFPTSVDYFSHDKGVQDGQAAASRCFSSGYTDRVSCVLPCWRLTWPLTPGWRSPRAGGAPAPIPGTISGSRGR